MPMKTENAFTKWLEAKVFEKIVLQNVFQGALNHFEIKKILCPYTTNQKARIKWLYLNLSSYLQEFCLVKGNPIGDFCMNANSDWYWIGNPKYKQLLQIGKMELERLKMTLDYVVKRCKMKGKWQTKVEKVVKKSSTWILAL